MSVPAPIPTSRGAVAGEGAPAGLYNAHWFAVFNALSWQIALGAPIILFAKGLGASATVLGVITALTPLLVIFQIPAAYVLPRFGYRRFTLMGWGLRTLAVFGLAGVPLLGMVGVGRGVQLGLVLGLLVGFNTLRGIASGAWMPWLAEIVPASMRATFLSRDNFYSNVGSLLSLGVAAALLMSAGEPEPWQFTLVFGFSAVMALVSLRFLSRIPDVTAPERLRSSGHPVPWRQMLMWGPFLRIVGFVVTWLAVVGGLGTFTVAYLRGVAEYSDSEVLLLSGVTIGGALGTVWLGGRLCDRWDSPRVLRGCVGALLAGLLGWAAVASGVMPSSVGVVAVLNFVIGAAGVNFHVASQRLTMATFPLMGRNHFFAMFSVITNLSLGLSPIVWGLLIDAVGERVWAVGGAELGRFAVYFLAAGVVAVGAMGLAWRLPSGPPHNPVHPAQKGGPAHRGGAGVV